MFTVEEYKGYEIQFNGSKWTIRGFRTKFNSFIECQNAIDERVKYILGK